ncbi:MAG: hypothetical protein AAF829_04450 [Pseudomonadota bacterium]
MPYTNDQKSTIDEKSLRQAISHLSRWHAAGSVLSLIIAFVPAFLIVSILPEIDFVRIATLNVVEVLPFVTEVNTRRREVIVFVLGALLLLVLTNIGTGIASDMVRSRIIQRINAQPNPVDLAEAMKARLRARSGRLEQQYRFFPKHSGDGMLQSNGLFVGIGTMAPFWLLMVFFIIYLRW